MNFRTPQEDFWAGEFGDKYLKRNPTQDLLPSNISLFADALKSARKLSSVIEFGANIGNNLKALKALYPKIDQYGIEINVEASKELEKVIPKNNIYNSSILEFIPHKKWDLVLIKGVLIHINPEYLSKVYDLLYKSTSRYIMITEYYNPTPLVMDYRGHKDRLFKRDFCGEILDMYSDLELIDYGFVYHRDPKYPVDDLNWFLIEKIPPN